MSTPDQQLAFSARFLRRSVALACAALLLLSSAASAGTVLQFAQTNPADVVTATNTGGTSTTLSTTGNVDGGGVSIPIIITNFLGTPGVNIPAFETYVGVTSTGAAATFGGQIFQPFAGTIEFTSGVGGTGVDYLTVTFSASGASSPLLSGAAGGGAANLLASSPPNSMVPTSDFAALSPPASMAIAFSNVSPPLGVTGTSVSSFTGQNAGTISATVIPEPSSLCLASFAVVFGVLVYRKKR